MATLHPFRALRPEPAQAAAVASVPYDVVNTDEARALAAGDLLSFLRVSRAEIELPPDVDPYADVVYETAVANFARLRAAAPLVEESAASVYVYRLRMGDHEQTGIAACFSVDEYEQNVIRKHERTRKDKEDDRTRHIIDLRAQTGPAFLIYPARPAIDDAVARVTTDPPLFDFAAVDGIHHTVWRAPDAITRELVAAFRDVPLLYIADGHHRAASAMRARTALRERAGGAASDAPTSPGPAGSIAPVEADFVLAVAFPHDQTRILPYHRVVKDLAGRTPDDFLGELSLREEIEPGTDTPARSGHVSMYLDGQWYTLHLTPAGPGTPAADTLDVALLQEQVLAPILGIGDPRTDKRIDFVGGIRGPGALSAMVDMGDAAVAFAMYPVSVEDLMRIADAEGIMPPKSTWFEPKLRDGLLSHLI